MHWFVSKCRHVLFTLGAEAGMVNVSCRRFSVLGVLPRDFQRRHLSVPRPFSGCYCSLFAQRVSAGKEGQRGNSGVNIKKG